MRVSVETTTGLERKATVAVPAESFQAAMAEFLKQRAATLKLPGFRPGKVPMKEVQRRFGTTARAEVTQTVVNTSFADVVAQEKLAVVGVPQVEVVSSASAGNDFEYTATFEVMPVIELQPFEQLSINVPQVEIADSDVDDTVELLREQQVEWTPAERPAAEKDRVTMDYVVKVDGESVLEGDKETLIVGGDHRVTELPAAVVGMAAGETRTFPVSLAFRKTPEAADETAANDEGGEDGAAETDAAAAAPDGDGTVAGANAAPEALAAATPKATDSEPAVREEAVAEEAVPDAREGEAGREENAAGQEEDDASAGYIRKDGIGEVSLRGVEAPQLPAVDDAFFDKLGIAPGPDRVSEFRSHVRRRMQSELEQAVRRAQRQEVASVLRDAYDFDLPDVLVRAELAARMRRVGLTLDLDKMPPQMAQLLYINAADEVRLGLVLTEIARREQIELDRERLYARVAELASEFEDPGEAQRALLGNQESLQQVAGVVMEDQAIEHLLARADVTRLPCSYADAIIGRALPRRPLPPPPSAVEQDGPAAGDEAAAGREEATADETGAPAASAGQPPADDAAAPAADVSAGGRGFVRRLRRFVRRAK